MQTDSAGPTVLLVEDDVRLRDRLVLAFKDRGWRPLAAADAPAASALAQDELIDLAVIDLRLGGSSGIEAIRTLRETDVETVILVLTGYGSIATAVAAVKAGAADYLTKPADVDQLLTAYHRAHSGITPALVPASVPSLDQVEWDHIHRVLADCGGNISHAARLLGVHRRSLQRKLAKRPLPHQ